MAIDFPTSPSLNDTYTYGGKSWIWNGYGWVSTSGSSLVSSLNGITGALSVSAGDFIAVSVTGTDIVVSADLPLAGTGSTGVASFFDDHFTITGQAEVRIRTGILAGTFIVLGSGGTGGVGKLPAVDGSELLEVNAQYLRGKSPEQVTDGGSF